MGHESVERYACESEQKLPSKSDTIDLCPWSEDLD